LLKLSAGAGRQLTSKPSEFPRERENSPLELLAEAKPQSRRKWKKREVVPHIRHGRFPRAVERYLEREKPPLSELDGAEIERLLAKHAGGRP
jgi:hypothetical protein